MNTVVPCSHFRNRLRRNRVALACCAGLLAFGSVGGAAASRPTGRTYPSVGDTPLAPADPRSIPGYGLDPISLLGPSRLTAAQMAESVARDHTPRITVSIEELAQLYIEEGASFGVRADMAWTQAIVETGWFTYPDGGLVKPNNNNFAGMGACDSCADGNNYPDARTGVRAQMHQLRGYADPNGLPNPINKPPDSYLGSAPTWLQMGNGHWATSTRYAETILSVYTRLLAEHGLTLDYEPPTRAEPDPVVPARQGDGLFLAGIDGQVYDVGDARAWGSAVNRSLRSPVVEVVPTPTANGYWVITGAGGVYGYGDARVPRPRPPRTTSIIAAAAATPSGIGFWIASRSGEVRAYGDAAPIEPAAGMVPADSTIVGIAPTAGGLGYWLVDSEGRVTPVGDAVDFGSMPAARPTDPIIGIAATPLGDGYRLASSRGRVFHFGAAKPHGGLFHEFDAQLNIDDFATFEDLTVEARARVSAHPVVAIGSSPTGRGYWLVTADGWVIGRGDAADFGDGTPVGEAVVGASSRRT